MSLKKIIRKNIEDSAVTEPKLSAGAVTGAKLSTDFITGQTELAEQAANDDVLLIYDSSAGALKKVSKANTTVLDSPTVSSVSPTSVVSDAGLTTFTITGTGFTAGTNARLIGSNGRVRNFATVTRDSTTQLTTTINVTTDMAEAETPYGVQVIDGTGLNDLLASQIDIDQYPVFVTASGSLGTFADGSRSGISLDVIATDPDSAADITFEVQSGSLPPGLSATTVNENGVSKYRISGTATAVGSDTTSNFTIRAADAASNTSSRAFSITILAPASESFTSSGTFSIPSGVTSIDVLVVAGGAGGGGGRFSPPAGTYRGGGGGAGGLTFIPSYPVISGGTITVTVGNGGNGGASFGQGQNGGNSVFGSPSDPGLSPTGGVITSTGGGGGGGGYGPCAPSVTVNANQGGSGGGGGSVGGIGGTSTQVSHPNFPGTGFGNSGGDGLNTTTGNAGGGGGAGAAGNPSTNGQPAGAGGAGRSYTIADGTTPVTYSTGGTGGSSTPASNAAANTGNGGRGNDNAPGLPGYAGGKGIVIVRY